MSGTGEWKNRSDSARNPESYTVAGHLQQPYVNQTRERMNYNRKCQVVAFRLKILIPEQQINKYEKK